MRAFGRLMRRVCLGGRIFQFDNNTVEEVFTILQRWYNIQVFMLTWRFGRSFSLAIASF
ncbi:MAG: FecR domain-containing protein [Butyricimonas faecihominis]